MKCINVCESSVTNRSTNFRVVVFVDFFTCINLGLPHPSTFPFHSLSAQITGMRPAAHQLKAQVSTDTVTVPLAPQPDKIESLTASLQVKDKKKY